MSRKPTETFLIMSKVNVKVAVWASRQDDRREKGSRPLMVRELYQVEPQSFDISSLCSAMSFLYSCCNPLVVLTIEL